VQLLLGHTKIESTVRYLGIEVDDALEKELKRLQGASTDKYSDAEQKLGKVDTQINRIVGAIAEGTDTPALRIALLDLEEKRLELKTAWQDLRGQALSHRLRTLAIYTVEKSNSSR